MSFFRAVVLLVLTVQAGVLSAQLTGTYTCANGNPGSAFDYGDIGAFFAACETQGISGPVTLNVFDDGGAFTSTASYGLGVLDTGGIAAINGLSAVNTISVVAAQGEFPVIQGSGGFASSFNVSATIAVQASHVRFEGLELIGGSSAGISIYGNPLINVQIRRCRVHGVTVGPGISIYSDVGGPITDSVLENNVVWNCVGGSAGFGTFQRGALACRRLSTTSIVRHNTVIHNNAAAGSGAFGYLGGTGGASNYVFEGNIFVNSTAGAPVLDIAAGFDPLPSNNNIYYATNGATFHSSAAFPNFAAWQTSGRDPQGLSTDPMLLSILPSNENFHLAAGSPAIDKATGSPTLIDVEGDPRPHGGAPDAGADEISGPPAEIEVLQGATGITDGGAVAAGNVSVAGVPVTFTVRNTGVGNLILTGTPAVTLAIVNNCDPTTVVQVQPAPTLLPTNQSTQFSVLLDPIAVGPFSLTISINNNDPDENPFNFTINGTAVPANAPAVANAPAGSSFAGAAGGPFTQVVNPGATLAMATIELTDVESDTITVTSIVPSGASPLGIAAPVAPAPGHPLLLTWTGTADASNPPGIYTWTVNFEDAVSGIPSSASVSIQVANIAPAHVAAAGQTGDGSVGNPYTMAFSEGVNGSISIDFANVSDANLGQVVLFAPAPSQTGGPVGTGFQFSLAAGVLAAAPAGTLVPSDVGVQQWLITLSDGALSTQVRVAITVNPAPSITTTSLPAGMEGTLYSETVTTTGGTGTLTVTLLSGSLPTGLTVGASGLVSGTPSVAPQTTNFVLTVTDTQGSNSSRALSITIQVNPALTPLISTASPLPIGEVDAVYVGVTFAATQGTPAYTWSQPLGTIPPGLTLSAAGALAGTPTSAGAYTFTVRVTDSALKFSDKVFNITIDPKPVPPPGGGTGGSSGGGGCAASSAGALAMPILALLAWRRRRS